MIRKIIVTKTFYKAEVEYMSRRKNKLNNILDDVDKKMDKIIEKVFPKYENKIVLEKINVQKQTKFVQASILVIYLLFSSKIIVVNFFSSVFKAFEN